LPDRPQLSVIIPVLNEADCLDHNLAGLFALPFINDHCEVIVCDGGSCDQSVEIAARYPCQVIYSEAGRALQMNRGASLACAPQLLFLHADTALPENIAQQLPAEAQWGFFRLHLNHEATSYRVIETAINWRSRITRVAGGDQALFFSKAFFASLGGFPSIPLMEDIAICKAARRLASPCIVPTPVSSSSRRWQNHGLVKTIVLMWSLRLAYWLGVSPTRLQRIYYPQRG
jgi:rSAM/selenodomain-associated transferase 2